MRHPLSFMLFLYNTVLVRAKARNTFRFHRQRAKRESLAELPRPRGIRQSRRRTYKRTNGD